MRALLLTIFLALAPVTVAQQQGVQEEVAQATTGQYFIRLHNTVGRWVSCYYSDDYNFFTFTIAPYTTTVWSPIYGSYVWECLYI